MSKSKTRRAAVQPIPETTSLNIPFDRLRLSEKNVRTIYDVDGIAQLADSIAENGLIQSLSVRPVVDGDGVETGDYEVQAGGRRFRALSLLVQQKRRDAAQLTPCVVKTAGYAEDDSYVENAQREPLHPIDEFNAFKAMRDAGKSEAAIASSHRVGVSFVRQRLRLAAVSPRLLEAFRNDEMELEQLMAYCVTDDHERQESVWERVKGTWNDTAHGIRQALTENTVRSTDQRVRFVGLEAYEAAGGMVQRDLFSNADDSYLSDVELLNRLVDAKLEQHKAEHLAMGWQWAEAAVDIRYDRKMGLERLIGEDPSLTTKEQKLLTKLTAELKTLDAMDELDDEQDARREELQDHIDLLENKPPVYAADDMARAGVFLSLDRQGRLSVDAGYIKPEPQQVGSVAGADGDVDVVGAVAAEEQADEPVEGNKPLSASLIEDLTSYRTVALREAMANNFDIAFVSVIHAMALVRFYAYAAGKTCLQLRMDTSFPAKADGLDQWPVTKAMAQRDLHLKSMLPKDSDGLWDALMAMGIDDRQNLFAHLASTSVNAVESPHARRAEALQHAGVVAQALGLDIAKSGWVTTSANYLGRVSKDRILAAVVEARGEDTASLIAHLKKEPMAMEAERLLQGTGWLPAVLRTSPIDEAGQDENVEVVALPAFLGADAGEAAAA